MLATRLEFFASLDRFQDMVPMPAILGWLRRAPITPDNVRDHLIFSPDRYVRNLLHTGPAYQVLVLCWRNGQRTPIHNHLGSNCGVRVIRGVATETVFTRALNGMIMPTGSHELAPGHICVSADDDIHQLSNLQAGDADLVTLHLYSPPLLQMEIFSLEYPGARCWEAPVNEFFAVGGGI